MNNLTAHPAKPCTEESSGATGSNFAYSFRFLSREKRHALCAVYAFARRVDDCVDLLQSPDEKRNQLTYWKTQLHLGLNGQSAETVMNQLGRVIRQYEIPVQGFEDLIRGCEMDIDIHRYETYEKLREYCYHVASTVGLMCLPIFDCRSAEAKEYAIRLGQALQFTNILRDVGTDADRGRIYLPQEDLRRFGCREEHLLGKVYAPEFTQLMEFECQRADALFQEALSALPPDARQKLLPARVMAQTYRAILKKIIACNYQVFGPKITLSRFQKIRIALLTWLGLLD